MKVTLLKNLISKKIRDKFWVLILLIWLALIHIMVLVIVQMKLFKDLLYGADKLRIKLLMKNQLEKIENYMNLKSLHLDILPKLLVLDLLQFTLIHWDRYLIRKMREKMLMILHSKRKLSSLIKEQKQVLLERQ